MSERHTDPGAGPAGKEAEKAAHEAAKAQAKRAKAEAEAEAKEAQRRAERAEEKAHEEQRAEHPAESEAGETPAEREEKVSEAEEPAKAEAQDEEPVEAEQEAEAPEEEPEEVEVVEDEGYAVKAKPELDEALQQALRVRAEKKAKQPTWRRQEWFRYKKLGGKRATWRVPRGMHSKMRRHYKFRPNVVSVGFRGPAAARGLHPSGFEDVLVHRPEDLEGMDPKTQAARVGRTVGGRKAELIQNEADKLGIRILNRRS